MKPFSFAQTARPASSNIVTPMQRMRVLLVLSIFAAWVAIIGMRLVWLQVVRHPEFVERAARQQQRTITVSPRRGILYDRTLHELAMTVSVDSIYAVPGEIEEARRPLVAAALAKVLHTDPIDTFTAPGQILTRINSSRYFTWVARKQDPKVIAAVKALGLKGDLSKQAEKLVSQLYTAFVAKDMAMLEINPLVVTKQGDLRVLDAKVSFDDNSLFRHPEVVALRDETEEDAKEIEASKYDLNYVTLDGNIGCMVNGAGLAMATMDIIKLYGMAPANFLDVGGSATVDKVAAAFKIITADPNVKGILVNIFGGIMKCDVIAQGVVAAVKQVGLQVPLVVRLEGTNVEAGKKIIGESGLNVLPADNLDDAAQKIVKAGKGG